MIYFAQGVGGGPVKIGYSEDVDARLCQLESHYGQPLALLATMPGDFETEAEIHKRFAHLRFARSGRRGVNPEQFRPAADLMAFIGRPLLVAANPDATEAMAAVATRSVINLKGSEEYQGWLSEVSSKTHIPATVIVRLGLALWAEKNGHKSPPEI